MKSSMSYTTKEVIVSLIILIALGALSPAIGLIFSYVMFAALVVCCGWLMWVGCGWLAKTFSARVKQSVKQC